MELQFESAGPQRLCLQGDLTIYTATAARETLLEHIAGGDLELELSAVAEIDSAGLQLLMSAKLEARHAAHELRLVNHSTAVLELIELLHVGNWLGDPLLLPAAGKGQA